MSVQNFEENGPVDDGTKLDEPVVTVPVHNKQKHKFVTLQNEINIRFKINRS